MLPQLLFGVLSASGVLEFVGKDQEVLFDGARIHQLHPTHVHEDVEGVGVDGLVGLHDDVQVTQVFPFEGLLDQRDDDPGVEEHLVFGGFGAHLREDDHFLAAYDHFCTDLLHYRLDVLFDTQTGYRYFADVGAEIHFYHVQVLLQLAELFLTDYRVAEFEVGLAGAALDVDVGALSQINK